MQQGFRGSQWFLVAALFAGATGGLWLGLRLDEWLRPGSGVIEAHFVLTGMTAGACVAVVVVMQAGAQLAAWWAILFAVTIGFWLPEIALSAMVLAFDDQTLMSLVPLLWARIGLPVAGCVAGGIIVLGRGHFERCRLSVFLSTIASALTAGGLFVGVCSSQIRSVDFPVIRGVVFFAGVSSCTMAGVGLACLRAGRPRVIGGDAVVDG